MTRHSMKRLLVFSMHLLTWPLAQPARLMYRRFGSAGLFQAGGALLSLVPGLPGQFLRTSFYLQTLKRCTCDLSIGFLSMVTDPRSELDRYVYVGSLCILGYVRIDSDISIASRVAIGRARAPVAGVAAVDDAPVRIGTGCWIGENVNVMADVGSHCIVGAGATVTEPVRTGTTVAGNPLRVIAENKY